VNLFWQPEQTRSSQRRHFAGTEPLKTFQKGIPFPNTIKYIFVFKEGNKLWELVVRKGSVAAEPINQALP
jgi:hypothetical protein